MRRFLRQFACSITLVGYFLAVVWGPAWHDHDHGHCQHSHARGQASPEQSEVPQAHHCCGHDHASCRLADSDQRETPAERPHRHAPLHDEDCVVCQLFAHAPLAAPEVKLVDAVSPVLEWVLLLSPQAELYRPAAYDSRGPPVV